MQNGPTCNRSSSQASDSACTVEESIFLLYRRDIDVVQGALELHKRFMGGKINRYIIYPSVYTLSSISLFQTSSVEMVFHILEVCFRPDLQLQKNWLQVQIEVGVSVLLGSERCCPCRIGLSFVLFTYLNLSFILGLFPLSGGLLIVFKGLLSFLWMGNRLMIERKLCIQRPFHGGPETWQVTQQRSCYSYAALRLCVRMLSFHSLISSMDQNVVVGKFFSSSVVGPYVFIFFPVTFPG